MSYSGIEKGVKRIYGTEPCDSNRLLKIARSLAPAILAIQLETLARSSSGRDIDSVSSPRKNESTEHAFSLTLSVFEQLLDHLVFTESN